MPTQFTKPVSGAQLVTGIVGSVDLGGILAKAIEIDADRKASAEVLNRIIAQVGNLVPMFGDAWKTRATTSIDTLITDSRSVIKSSLESILPALRNQSGASAVGSSMTAQMLGQEIKNWNTFWGLDTYLDLFIGLPQTMIYRKAERYWNKLAAPELPSASDALMLTVLGKWTLAKYVSRLQEIDGLTASDAENIASFKLWQIGKPSLRDTYLMVSKGIKTVGYFTDLATIGHGFTPKEASDLYEYFSYDFSPSELLRLSDLIPLESAWVEKKLKGVGLTSEDALIFKTALEKRQIRDEINKIWSVLLDNYQWGLHTESDIRKLLDNWKFSQTEIDLRVQTGELFKVKLRVKLLRDAEIYLYRKGVTDEDTLLERLVALTIGKDIANAIVRNEAAKKGIEWEIPPE